MFYLKIYVPLISATILLIVAARYKFSEKQILPIRFFGVEIDITHKHAGRLVCLGAICAIILYFINIDFSQFFPEYYEMQVFYHPHNLQSCLSDYTKKELEELNYIPENQKFCEVYYNDLDKTLKQILKYDGFFSVSDGEVHSEGETSFKVTKINGIRVIVNCCVWKS